MTKLANKLAQYYEKKGNKILFCGKYSLSQLAIEMWEQLNYQGIEPSSLSRILKGDRLFTHEQLELFCKILKISKKESKELFVALENDMLNRYGLTHIVTEPNLIDTNLLLDNNIKQYKMLRERGMVEIIPEWIDTTINFLKKNLNKSNHESIQKHTIQLLGEAYFEKAYAYGCIYPGNESSIYVYPLIKKIFSLANNYKNNQLSFKASVLLSYTYYSLGKYSINSIHTNGLYLKGFDSISSVLKNNDSTNEFSLMGWRCLALNSMYLNDQTSFNFASQKIKEIISINSENPTISFSVWALASVARGESYFKSTKTEKTLEQVKLLDSKIPWTDPLRKCALIRNEIEVLDNLHNDNNHYKRKLSLEGIKISREFNYQRYVNYFTNYLYA